MTTFIQQYPHGALGPALAVFDIAKTFREIENLKKFSKLLEKSFKENAGKSALARKKFCRKVLKSQAKSKSLTVQKIIQTKFFQSMQASCVFPPLQEKFLDLMESEIAKNYFKNLPLKEDEGQAFHGWLTKFLRCFASKKLILGLQNSHMAEVEKARLMADITSLSNAQANKDNPCCFFVPSKKFMRLINVNSQETVELRRGYPFLIKANQCVLFCALDKSEKGAIGNTWTSFLESRGPKLLPFIVEYEKEIGVAKVVDLKMQRKFLSVLSWGVVKPFGDDVFLKGFMQELFMNFFLHNT